MTVTDVLRAVRGRWLLFVLCCLVPVTAAIVVAWVTTPDYKSTAELFITPTAATRTSDAYQGGLFAQQQAPSYARLANSPSIMKAVIANLHLTMSASQLAKQVSAASPTDSVLINVTAHGSTGDAARAIANDVAARLAAAAESLTVAGAPGHTPLKITLVKPATLPTSPISPRPTTDLAVGLVVGFAVAFAAVILREKADGRVRTAQQAQSSTGCGLVAVVDGARGRAGSRGRGREWEWTIPESFRRLRVRLTPAMAGCQTQNLAVASLVPGDPSPAVATYLALALAESGSTVALMDTDLDSPGIAGYFGIAKSPGTISVVSGNTPLEIAAYRYNERLLILPAGASGTAASRQTVSRAELSELLRQRGRAIHHAVVHVGPIIANADGADLCSEVHMSILVVRKDRTRQQDLRLATEILRSTGAEVAGIVLASARFNPAPPAFHAAGQHVQPGLQRSAWSLQPDGARQATPSRTAHSAGQLAVPRLPDGAET